MRISVLEQVKKFLRDAKINNSYVYLSKDIKLTIKNYLREQQMLYSPIRGIYVLKKRDQFIEDIVEKYKFQIIEKLGGIISGDFAQKFHMGNYTHIKDFHIVTQNKSFQSKLGEYITLTFIASKVPRIQEIHEIENARVSIESPLSLYINNYKNIPENSDFIRFLMGLDIHHTTIEDLINKGFKISGISKLALIYKQNGFGGKHKIIMNTLRQAGKQIDYRKPRTQVSKTNSSLSPSFIEDLDSLI